MRLRSLPMVAMLLLLVIVAACGSVGTGGAQGAPVTPDAARRAVERAAGVTLEVRSLPGEAKQQGVIGWYSNGAEVEGGQIIQLTVLDSVDKVNSTRERLAAGAGSTSEFKVLTGKNVICIYGFKPGVGKDNSAAVEAALKGL